jgi:hypothetical protein
MSSKSTSNKDGKRVKASAEVETPHDDARSSERDESIRLRAYQLFLERGQVFGQELDDWLQAEKEIGDENA